MTALEKSFEQQIISKYENLPQVDSVIMFTHRDDTSQLIDGFDVLWLVLTNEQAYHGTINHYIKDSRHIQEYWVDHDSLHQWIMEGSNRNIIQWVLQGKIIVDKSSFLMILKEELLLFPKPMKEHRLFVEFSSFLRDYLQCKEYLRVDQILDSYSKILNALHHWARIVIIEHGDHPEITVWKQVRKINPGVYKLYEELTLSQETLKERVELVLLACEFSVMSKMRGCCNLLFRLMETKENWSLHEMQHYFISNQMYGVSKELSLILRKLVKRNMIHEEIITRGGLPEVIYKLK